MYIFQYINLTYFCLDSKLDVNDKADKDPVIEDEGEKQKLGSANATSVGGVSSTPSEGLNFSTNIGDSEPKREEAKGRGASATSSGMSSGTPSAPKKANAPKSKYFDNIEPAEMTRLMTEFQQEDPEEFKNIM